MTGFAQWWGKMMPSAADYPQSRLFSLDFLRGLDLLLLVAIGPLLRRAFVAWECFPESWMSELRHNWSGFTLWDLIMPLFIFMCGASMPFALGRRLEQGRLTFWKHVLWRVVLLWFLGGLVQGEWASLDPMKMAPYSNTLHAIAIGYLITAMLMCARSIRVMILAAVVMSCVYAITLAFFGDYSQFGNFAFKIEDVIRRAIYPSGHVRLVKPSYYTWYYTTLMFVVMTLCGYFSTTILRGGGKAVWKSCTLGVFGVSLLVVGVVAGIWIPIIKPIFTFSFTALAMGWSILLLTLLYVINDILQIRKGASLVLLFGQCALVAYFVSHFFRKPLEAVADVLIQGVVYRVDAGVGSFLREVVVVMVVILVMAAWRRLKMTWGGNN